MLGVDDDVYERGGVLHSRLLLASAGGLTLYLRFLCFSVPPMSLGTQLKHYRAGLGLTLDQLSRKSGVDVGTISALESRGSCRSKFAPDLARALRLSLDQFLDERYDFLPQLKMGVIPAPIGAHSGGAVAH